MSPGNNRVSLYWEQFRNILGTSWEQSQFGNSRILHSEKMKFLAFLLATLYSEKLREGNVISLGTSWEQSLGTSWEHYHSGNS